MISKDTLIHSMANATTSSSSFSSSPSPPPPRNVCRDMIHDRPEHLGAMRSLPPRRQQQQRSPILSPQQEESLNDKMTREEEKDDNKEIAMLHEEPQGTTLGDIMTSSSNSGSSNIPRPNQPNGGLVLYPRFPLAETYGFSNPLDRMVLTANGNLQRLISSYYDSTVSVYVDYCDQRPTATMSSSSSFVAEPNGSIQQKNSLPPPLQTQLQPSSSHASSSSPATTPVVWDRVVHLTVLNHTFCTATSVITVRDPLCVSLVESGQVGLGQLFRYLDLLPEFALINAGQYDDKKNNDNNYKNNHANIQERRSSFRLDDDDEHGRGGGGFWREYALECPELSCWIHEEFIAGLWTLDQ